ncbi:hypothetical protein Tco_1523848 [Tanacetum coccineum]
MPNQCNLPIAMGHSDVNTFSFNGFIDVEELKANQSLPFKLKHVELDMTIVQELLVYLSVMDAIFWCCPRSLTLNLKSIWPDSDFEEWSQIVKVQHMLEHVGWEHTKLIGVIGYRILLGYFDKVVYKRYHDGSWLSHQQMSLLQHQKENVNFCELGDIKGILQQNNWSAHVVMANGEDKFLLNNCSSSEYSSPSSPTTVYQFSPTGIYMWHCGLIKSEDQEMN